MTLVCCDGADMRELLKALPSLLSTASTIACSKSMLTTDDKISVATRNFFPCINWPRDVSLIFVSLQSGPEIPYY